VSCRAFGAPVHVHPRLHGLKTLICFECDLLGSHPDRLRLAREFALERPALYVVERDFSLTGANADRRWAAPNVEEVLAELAAGKGELASFLKGGPALVLAGESLSPQAQALALQLSDPDHYGVTKAVDEHPLPPVDSITKLCEALEKGEVG